MGPLGSFFLRHGGPPPKALHQSGLTMGKMSVHGEPKFSEGQPRVFTNQVRVKTLHELHHGPEKVKILVEAISVKDAKGYIAYTKAKKKKQKKQKQKDDIMEKWTSGLSEEERASAGAKSKTDWNTLACLESVCGPVADLRITKVQSPFNLLKSCALAVVVLKKNRKEKFQLMAQTKKTQWIGKVSWCAELCIQWCSVVQCGDGVVSCRVGG